MTRSWGRLALALSAATAVAACGSQLFPQHGNVQAVDLLVLVPAPSGTGTPAYPPQIIHASSSELQSGSLDLHLAAGTELDGTVMTAGTAASPIAGAAVRISMHGAAIDQVAQSDAQGKFAVRLGPGVYDVTVTPDPATTPNLPPHVFQNVGIQPSTLPIVQTFSLEEGPHIRGVIQASDGSFLNGFRIAAHEDGGVQTSTFANTSVVGSFEIVLASTGSWVVTIQPPSSGTSTYPVVAETVAVAGTAGIGNFSFKYPTGQNPYLITGTVTGTGSAAGLPGVTVRAKALLSSADPNVAMTFDQSTLTDANGQFSVPAVPGTYSVLIEPAVDSAFSHAVVDSVQVSADTPLQAAVTTLKPKATVAGDVVGDKGGGVGDALMHFQAADGSIYQFSKITDGSGNWTLPLNVGSYTVDIVPSPTSGHVRSSTTLTVDHDATGQRFTVPAGAVVSGRVFGGSQPIAGVSVLALTPGPSTTAVGSGESITDGGGRWTLTVPLSP